MQQVFVDAHHGAGAGRSVADDLGYRQQQFQATELRIDEVDHGGREGVEQ